MPTGFYTLREKKQNYKKQTRYSKQSIQWLEYLMREKGWSIRHAQNSPHGEKRIGNYSVDGFSESLNTVFEFYGCYHHGHCGDNHDAEKWGKNQWKEKKNCGIVDIE